MIVMTDSALEPMILTQILLFILEPLVKETMDDSSIWRCMLKSSWCFPNPICWQQNLWTAVLFIARFLCLDPAATCQQTWHVHSPVICQVFPKNLWLSVVPAPKQFVSFPPVLRSVLLVFMCVQIVCVCVEIFLFLCVCVDLWFVCVCVFMHAYRYSVVGRFWCNFDVGESAGVL